MIRADLDDFVACHRPAQRHERASATWSGKAPDSDPHLLAEEIAEDLRDALGQIEGVLADLKARVR
jgi:hypothetical protein